MVKKARRRRAWIVFEDESCFSLLTSVRATWAPRGKTPVLTNHFNWKVWGNLKNREPANLCPDSVEEAAVSADDGLMRICSDTRHCLSFLKHCGLSL